MIYTSDFRLICTHGTFANEFYFSAFNVFYFKKTNSIIQTKLNSTLYWWIVNIFEISKPHAVSKKVMIFKYNEIKHFLSQL